MKPRQDRSPTTTKRVSECLSETDFITAHQIAVKLKIGVSQVAGALLHLRNYQAADSVASEGRLWWFATPASDTRIRELSEAKPQGDGYRGGTKPQRGRQPPKEVSGDNA